MEIFCKNSRCHNKVSIDARSKGYCKICTLAYRTGYNTCYNKVKKLVDKEKKNNNWW